MEQQGVDRNSQPGIMTPKETADFFRKSQSWVYKNWEILGGRKLKGSIFFPSKEDLYEHLFCKGEGMEVRLHPGRSEVFQQLVQHQSIGKGRRSKEKGGDQKPDTGTGTSAGDGNDPNRHGLLGTGQSAAGSRKGV